LAPCAVAEGENVSKLFSCDSLLAKKVAVKILNTISINMLFINILFKVMGAHILKRLSPSLLAGVINIAAMNNIFYKGIAESLSGELMAPGNNLALYPRAG
jgi:hypothetical protein